MSFTLADQSFSYLNLTSSLRLDALTKQQITYTAHVRKMIVSIAGTPDAVIPSVLASEWSTVEDCFINTFAHFIICTIAEMMKMGRAFLIVSL